MDRPTALIIGAGPAGLTAALELLRHSNIRPIVLEASACLGGISRTVQFAGNRMDLGGHRFFSRSDWVMDWWQQIMPLEDLPPGESLTVSYQNQHRRVQIPAAAAHGGVERELVMLVRDRLSRIYFGRRLYDYPVRLSLAAIRNLGPLRCLKISASYARAAVFPRLPEKNLEDFLVNRFGTELYQTFFRSYTEKVWGVPCTEISSAWGAQRIKSLSLAKTLLHALRQRLRMPASAQASGTPTSLVERFLYPRLGPGQLWEAVAAQVVELGGEIRLSQRVDALELAGGRITGVTAQDVHSGARTRLSPDWVISSMALNDLIAGINPPAPPAVNRIAQGLPYRCLITVGVVARRMKSRPGQPAGSNRLPDNWVYIQEPDVKLGRLQIFNNWSPALVADPDTVWLGLEYFCDEGDGIWQLSDADMQALAIRELDQIDLVAAHEVLAATVIRVPKAYPAYFGTFAEFAELRRYVDAIENLFVVGRNGMHRYNNQDHSMLTAKAAVDNIIGGITDKSNIWQINVDDDYHEVRSSD